MNAASDRVDAVDVAVIGGGVVGAAVARLLSQHRISVALVDAAPDVGAGTSKANTAILHTGFDATPGSTEAGLVRRGYELLRGYAPAVGISIEETGAVLVAWDDDQAAALPGLHRKAVENGYQRAVLLDPTEVYALEPALGPGARGGMLVPDEHIIDPWTTPLAFAHDAVANGAVLRLGTTVTGADIGPDTTLLATGSGSLRARYVVNAAGLGGDLVHRAFGFDGFTIRPRRGELIVFDKLARPLVRRTLLPVPTKITKGVLVAPTVFGNVMLGPTADDIDDRTATGTTAAGLQGLLDKGRRILPGLLDHEVTATYAGLRAATEHSDYVLWHDAGARYVCLGGIRSTGLSASMALAEAALDRLRSCGLDAAPKDPGDVVAVRLQPLGEVADRPYLTGARVVCHCERVTEAEVSAACGGPIPAVDLDGIRRRTRAMAGRCQGFHCLAEVVGCAAAASGSRPGSWMGLA